MRYRSIVFDLDGTLIDSAHLTGFVLDEMLADRNVDQQADRRLIREMDAVGGQAMIAAVLGRHTSDPLADLEEFRRRHRQIEIPDDIVFPGIITGIDVLRTQGIDLAICSNKPQDLCEKILTELGLASAFSVIIGSAASRPRKPAPEPAMLAIAELRGMAHETLFCGDSDIDIVTARAAGLQVALVKWGYGSSDAKKHHPDVPLIDTMPDLVRFIQGGAVTSSRNPGCE